MKVPAKGLEIIIFLFGMFLILWSLNIGRDFWKDLHSDNLTHGKVIFLDDSSYAKITFADKLGKNIVFSEHCINYSRHSYQVCQEYALGEDVLVVYDPRSPEQAKTVDILYRTLKIFILVLAGGFLLAVFKPLSEKITASKFNR